MNTDNLVFVDQTTTKRRQRHYLAAMTCEERGDWIGAIAAYETYCACLAEEDRYIPHQWIAKIQQAMGNTRGAIEHLLLFAQGCTPLRAAEVYKEVGFLYEQLGERRLAIEALERAGKANPRMGLGKIVAELREEVLGKVLFPQLSE